MALSSDILTQFAKLVKTEEKDNGKTLNGTYKKIDGKDYVQIDGSEILTPVNLSVSAETGDRVSILLKDHSATITSNITSPSASSKDVNDIKDEVDEQGNTIKQMDNTIIQQGNSIIQMETNINQQQVTINQHDTLINQQGDEIISINNKIVQQGNDIESINNTITSQGNKIDSMNNTIIQQGDNINSMNNTIIAQGNKITSNENTITQLGNQIQQQGNQIIEIDNTVQSFDNRITANENDINLQGNTIKAQGSQIEILNSGFVIKDGVLTGLSQIILDSIDANYLEAKYAKIDFANIGEAAIEKLFADSGIIKDLVMQNGHVTGELVGVTLKGDLIQGNTIAADKLLIKGSDGLYYQLNLEGLNNISVDVAQSFEVLNSKPEDWDSKWNNYYKIVEGKYVHLTDKNAPKWVDNTYYKLKNTCESGLDGSTIIAKTITADRISVNDLVAFGATIAGFTINEDSIHSEAKGSIESDANGLYMDKIGQVYFGDGANHIKYYKDTDDSYILDIRTDKLYFGANNQTIGEALDNQNSTNNDLYTQLTENKTLLEITAGEVNSKLTEFSEVVANNTENVENLSKDVDEKYSYTIEQVNEVSRKVDNISNIFQITGGGNLIKNSVWYYKTNNKPNDWLINDDTIYDGGQDDSLIGETVSRGQIKIKNGSVQTLKGNISNILKGSSVTISYKYQNGDNTTSKIELYAGSDTDSPIIYTETFSDSSTDWVQVKYTFNATSDDYILKITSNSTAEEYFKISDLMLNYGEFKNWELASGEVFGATIKLNNQGIQVTSETANTETYMTTNGVNVFNRTTEEKVTDLTDDGITTKNAYVKKNIQQGDLMHSEIINSENKKIYVEYIVDE